MHYSQIITRIDIENNIQTRLDILQNKVFLVSISPSIRHKVIQEVIDYVNLLQEYEIKVPQKLYNWIDYLNGVWNDENKKENFT